MAQTVVLRNRVRCLKEHLCVGCGGRFAYPLDHEAVGRGQDETSANLALQHEAEKILAEEFDPHPCPHCGALQPEMAARAVSTWFLAGMGAAVVGVLVAVALGALESAPLYTASWVAAAACLAALGTSVGAFWDRPNDAAGLRTGLSRAAREEQAGKLMAGPPGAVAGEPKPPKVSAARWALGLGLGAAAVLAAVAPNVLAFFAGWSMNPGVYPPVAGPGDVVCVRLRDEIASIRGLWNGSAQCLLKNADALRAAPTWSAETQRGKWDGFMMGRGLSNSSRPMWVNVRVPADDKLAYQAVDLALSAEVEFPFRTGGLIIKRYEDRSGSFSDERRLFLSSSGAGGLYFSLWWASQVAALLLAVFGSGVLMAAVAELRRLRSTSRAVPPGAPPGAA